MTRAPGPGATPDPILRSFDRYLLALCLGLLSSVAGFGLVAWLGGAGEAGAGPIGSVLVMFWLTAVFGWPLWLPIVTGALLPGFAVFLWVARRLRRLPVPAAATLACLPALGCGVILSLVLATAFGAPARDVLPALVLTLAALPFGLPIVALVYAIRP